jgi:ABC-type branched-subunit amino acid transport system substrate-binding protein
MSSLTAQTSTRVPWWWPTPLKLKVGALALVVIAGLSWAVWRATHCTWGVRRLGGECIGVTDGRFVFTPGLAPVMEKIREENRWVLAQKDRPSVSVAYLMPLPKVPDDVSEVYRHELQGAYLAQRRANHTNELGDQPLIRLILANAGERNERWQPVVDQLVGMVGSDQLVAVAGLGASWETTRQAITALTVREIPVIGSRLTADDLSGKPGFARVGFTNRDQVKAAVAFLKRDPRIRRALLIQDTNPYDPFSRTLGDAFIEEFPDATHELIQPPEVYDSNPSLGGVGNRLVQVIASICLQRPDVVYFAGAGPALEDFIEALPGRPCADFHINLVTGDSPGVRMDTPALRAGLGSRMTLQYTELAHPGAWDTTPEAFSPASIRYFRQDCVGEDCFINLFRTESIDDGAAVLGHDAVVIALRAIRLAAGPGNLTQNPLTPGEVLQQLSSLHGLNAVPGASGWVSLNNAGDPVDKAIPILAFRPNGRIEFIELSSPDGGPFRPPSLPPAG